MFTKRGISAIVATVLIILITVAAVTIVWSTVVALVGQDIVTEIGPTVTIEGEGTYTVYDPDENDDGIFDDGVLLVQVTQQGGDSIIEIKIIWDTQGTSNSIIVPAPGEKNTKLYAIKGFTIKPDTVSIAPIFLLEGNTKEGSIVDTAIVEEQDTIDYDDLSEDEYDSGDDSSESTAEICDNSVDDDGDGDTDCNDTDCTGELVCLLGGVCPSDSPLATEHLDVPYRQAITDWQGNPEPIEYTYFDYYRPSGYEGVNLPVVIFYHGGGWRTGDKIGIHNGPAVTLHGGPAAPTTFDPLYLELYNRGYAIISVNYPINSCDPSLADSDSDGIFDAGGIAVPFYPGIPYPSDCVPFELPIILSESAKAIQFVRDNAECLGIDTSKVIASGNSAGSATSALIGYNESFSFSGSRPNGLLLDGFGASARGAINSKEIGIQLGAFYSGDAKEFYPSESSNFDIPAMISSSSFIPTLMRYDYIDSTVGCIEAWDQIVAGTHDPSCPAGVDEFDWCQDPSLCGGHSRRNSFDIRNALIAAGITDKDVVGIQTTNNGPEGEGDSTGTWSFSSGGVCPDDDDPDSVEQDFNDCVDGFLAVNGLGAP